MSKPFNIHDWQAKQRLAEEDKKETLAISPEEMEQLHKTGKVRLKDGSLLVFAGDLNVKEEVEASDSMSNNDIAALEKIVRDYDMGKIQTVIKILSDRISEMSTTGTGASFQAGSGEAYATPKAFKKKKNINEVSYSDFKRNTESSPRQKIARGISQVSKMIKEIEKIVAHNFKLKTELDMNSGTFLKSTNRKIHELGARLKQLENKLREFSN
jgi:chaperonin cofactor prefoldin